MSGAVLLAIETSQRTGGVALRDRTGTVLLEALGADRGHDDDLMPAVDRLVRRAGLAPDDLDAVGVSVGPGGFTGLRIAIAVTKMLALALDVRLVAIPSAEVAVAGLDPAARPDGPILCGLAAKRESFWATVFDPGPEGWTARGPGALADATTAPLDGVRLVLADRYLPAPVRSRCGDAGIPIVEPVFDARACLRCAAERLERNATVDPLALRPLYPRPPEAVSLWEKRRRGPR